MPDEALALIARSATGSFRDALGTLEQLVAYSRHDDRRSTDVLAVLGAADADLLFGARRRVAAGDARAALLAAARLAESGRDLGALLRRPRGARARAAWSCRRWRGARRAAR